MPHLVVRQIFDVRLPTYHGASGVQQRLSRFFWEEMAPALERLFDRLSPEGQVLRIDRLEIDLGRVAADQLTGEATLDRLLAAVEAEIQRALHDTGQHPVTTDARGHVFHQWLHFLEHGVLPWYASGSLPTDWRPAVLHWLGLQAPAAEALRRLLARSEQALDRLSLQHDPSFLIAVAALLTGQPQQLLGDAAIEIALMFKPNTGKKRLPTRFRIAPRRAQTWLWKWAFYQITVQDRRENGTALAADFLLRALSRDDLEAIATTLSHPKSARDFPAFRRLFQEHAALAAVLLRHIKPVNPASAQPSILVGPGPDAPENTSGPGGSMADATATVRPERADVAGPGQIGASERPEVRPPGISAEAAGADANKPDAEGTWMVQGAGVILLQGYLPNFFARLDLLETDKSFRDEAARAKAATLIHYLAFGESAPPEYRLLLPKILCGIPVGQPLDVDHPLTDRDLEEAGALLEAVVGHWTALGNSSPGGLREGFLVRTGRLSRRDQGWLLRVERQTLDILLDHAPFAIGVVKLPWMKDILWVEW